MENNYGMNNMYSSANYNSNNEIKGAKISIIGVGGGGGNAVNFMKEKNITGVRYIAVNTDHQDLDGKNADIKIPLAELGAGGKPEIAKEYANEMRNEIKKQLANQDMVFITAGMGGGTGTGASPVVAEVTKELEILTIGIVTMPFKFEGPSRRRNAEYGINELRKYVDTLIVIPNDRLKNYNAEGMKARNVFHAPNDVLYRAVKGIVDIITKEGMINIDFADVKTVMENAGDAVIGLGEAKEGEDVILAVKYAVENPLLDRSLKGAKKALINITLPADAEFIEFEEIVDEVIKFSENDDLDVMLGVMFDETSTDTKVTVVATGFEDDVKPLSNVVSNREYVKPEENINNNPEYTVTLPTLD